MKIKVVIFFYVGDSKGTGHLEKNFRRGGTGSDLYLRKFTGGRLGMEWEERRVQDQFRGYGGHNTC